MKFSYKKLFSVLILIFGLTGGVFLTYRYLQKKSAYSSIDTQIQEEQIVEIKKVTLENYEKIIHIFGVIKLDSISVLSKEAGRIKYIVPKNIGSVKKGELLVEFEHEDKLLKLEKTKIEHQIIEGELKRQKDSLAVGGCSKQQYEESLRKERSLFFEMKVIENEISNSQIIAPFDCFVKHTDYISGSFVQHNQEVISVFRSSPIGVEGKMNIENIHNVKKDNGCVVKIDDRMAQGKIININRAIESYSASVIIRAEVENETNQPFFSGELCEIEIHTGIEEYLVALPENAIKPSGPKHKVFIVKDGYAFLKEVELCGKTKDGKVKVSGLRNGDIVVISGVERLTNFCKVCIV